MDSFTSAFKSATKPFPSWPQSTAARAPAPDASAGPASWLNVEYDPSDVMSPDDIIIGVMGMTGAGKTSFISHCMGEDVGIGHGLHSYTQDVAIHSFKHRGRMVRLIDTPGFDDTSKADVNILNNIAFWLSHAYRSKLLLSGMIYLHPISETRMVGTAVKNIEMMKLLCGEQNVSVIWLTSSMWDKVPESVGLSREHQLMTDESFWGGLVRHGASVRRHTNSRASAFAIIDEIVARNRLVTLKIQRQMVDGHLDVDKTDAGRHLCRIVHQEQQKVQNRLDRSAQELEEKFEAHQHADVEELLERQATYKKQLAEKDSSLETLRLNMEQLRKAKAKEYQEREDDFVQQKMKQDAKMADLDQEISMLRQMRDEAIREANEAKASQDELEEANFQLMLQTQKSMIEDIDSTIEMRRHEEEQTRREREAREKQENAFHNTLKVTAMHLLLRGAAHVAGHIVANICVVM